MKTYINFIDNVIQAPLPSEEIEPCLYDFIKLYQLHKHSNSCRKYKNKSCRYGSGRCFNERAIVAKPLDDSINDIKRYWIIQKRETNSMNDVQKYCIIQKRETNSINDVGRYCIIQNRETILNAVNNFFNSILDPSKEKLRKDLLI